GHGQGAEQEEGPPAAQAVGDHAAGIGVPRVQEVLARAERADQEGRGAEGPQVGGHVAEPELLAEPIDEEPRRQRPHSALQAEPLAPGGGLHGEDYGTDWLRRPPETSPLSPLPSPS